MRFSPILQSAEPPMDFPKRVWTPTGGWYVHNPNWKRNSLICIGVISILTIGTFKLSWDNERRFSPGYKPVFSQRFAKHTLEDDPHYYEKLEYWKQNKKPLWKRIFPTEEDMEE